MEPLVPDDQTTAFDDSKNSMHDTVAMRYFCQLALSVSQSVILG
jgi:hypothetical protein